MDQNINHLLLVFLLLSTGLDADQASPHGRRRRLTAAITRCNNHNNHNNEVNRQMLERNVKRADFVFTGKVVGEFDALTSASDDNTVKETDYRGYRVRLKRVLKGDLTRVNQIHLLLGKTADSDSEKYSHLCYSIIRVHHTAIFLTKMANFFVNSSAVLVMEAISDPMAITLRNLDRVNALVRDMTYRPRPQLLEEPCEKKYCPWGSNCVPDNEDSAHCECPRECTTDSTGPVCGTDDVTYQNQCLVRRKACLEQDNTRIRHSGQCGPPKRSRHP